ncbi:hypothetical protein H0I23_14580 [Cellulophaga sp. HaHaR_3_176]|uniref:hypothetical protein n=1 Tax=Cellulophaga sp. HaHaR_3_176 TaxID=1942464 RepID=UPI001C1FD5A5|nr:hypothetical protein [Cellulophaga sp. HaHaR_3_176]QWX83663.1 hypothetical protein H0I23_14580 [Cellulophaga sp. HaHaR_3_176]
MSKKKLDELFREQFRDYDATPDEKVWDNIEASLDKKDKRKIIPIWWKLGGVAAILVVFFSLYNPFEIIINDGIEEVDITYDSDNEIDGVNIEETQISDTESSDAKEEINTEKIEENHLDKNSSYVSNSTKKSSNIKKQNTVNFNSKRKSSVGANNVASSYKSTSEDQNNLINSSEVNKGSNVDNASENNIIVVNREIDSKQKNDYKALAKIDNNEAIANKLTREEEAAQKNKEKKKSIFDEIEEKEEEVAENNVKKWSVGPIVAPVYFNGIGEESPISSSFNPNSKTGDVNFSYGVSVAYEVSKKLKIRSGIHKVDYGYTTNQIEFSSSFNGASVAQLENINYAVNSENVTVNSAFVNTADAPSFSNDITGKNASLNGNLQQQFGYLEVPLEVNYALLDKRFGINIIGGLSSLFLVDNTVLLNSGDQSTLLGEANNINSINFSTNVGFGLNYNITPKFQFNVEPVFKYQLNTFSNTSGGFQPFSVGVYSGVNYKF